MTIPNKVYLVNTFPIYKKISYPVKTDKQRALERLTYNCSLDIHIINRKISISKNVHANLSKINRITIINISNIFSEIFCIMCHKSLDRIFVSHQIQRFDIHSPLITINFKRYFRYIFSYFPLEASSYFFKIIHLE